MIIDNYKLIEKYILGKLKDKKLLDFNNAMKNSLALKHEVTFQSDLSNAIKEQDIIDLRLNLNNIIKTKTDMNKDADKLFDLAKNLNQSQINDETNLDMNQIENTLQFIHIENHKKSQTERIHLISSDLQTSEIKNSKIINDDDLWKEITNSINEKDVIDLRNSLNQVISLGSTDISDFEIDQFLDNELTEDAFSSFENLIEEDKHLASQVKLHQEINKAFTETDISDLRSSIGNIIEEEQMVSFSEIKRIDDYLMNYLTDKNQNEFEELLTEDIRLNAETELNNEINNSILENDVMNLRSSIKNISSEDQADSKIRQFVPTKLTKKPLQLIGAVASLAAVVSIGSATLFQQKNTADDIYRKAYTPYDATGLYRSGSFASAEMLGIDKYNEQEYNSALSNFKTVLIDNPEHPMCNFYTGLCHQQLGEYNEAIIAFQNVIDEKDNLFIEQAEWFKALCLLKTSNANNAYKTFNAIIDKKGYYSKNAKEILKKLE